jgi:L-rhamnose mutarotase
MIIHTNLALFIYHIKQLVMNMAISFILSIVLSSSCSAEKRRVEVNSFRRFCFTSPVETIGNRVPVECLEISRFALDSLLFIIIDARPDMDLSDLQNCIAQAIQESNTHPSFMLNISKGKILPLERIYEQEQKQSYSPEEGQLKKRMEVDFYRSVLFMELNPDSASIRKYREAHQMGNVWPQIETNARASGVLDMELYIKGTRVFLIMDRTAGIDEAKSDSLWNLLPLEQEWQNLVGLFQKKDPATGEAWTTMTRIR